MVTYDGASGPVIHHGQPETWCGVTGGSTFLAAAIATRLTGAFASHAR
jgi:hypothetical protein